MEIMKNGKLLIILAVVAVASLFLAAGLFAGTTAPDVVKLQAAYEHTKPAVEFNHTKHTTEYKNAKGEVISCGECHHDDKGQPRTLKAGDDVKTCFECHNQPGELKGKDAKGKSDAELIKYHANAMHGNCIGCHRDYNKANKTKAAPQTCTGCHPKEK
jgi:co-chaperonin GroES (HSP10)